MNSLDLARANIRDNGQLINLFRIIAAVALAAIGIPYALLFTSGWLAGYGPALLAAALANALLGYFFFAGRRQKPPPWLITAVPFAQLLCDIALITALLHLSGGAVSPYIFLYLPVIFSASLLFTRSFWPFFLLTIFLIAAYETMLFLEFYGFSIFSGQRPWREMAAYLPQALHFSVIVPLALGLAAFIVQRLSALSSQRRDELEAETQAEITRLRAELEKKLEQTNAELHARNRELAETGEIFRQAFLASPFMTGISRLSDGRYVDVNDAFLRVLGYKREEVIGQSSPELNIFADPADRERINNILRQTGRVTGEPLNIRLRNGQRRSAVFYAEPIEIKGEKCLIATVEDITDLLESEAQFKAAFEYAPDAYYMSDPAGKLINGNLAAEKITGYQRQELIGRNFLEIGLLPTDQIPFAAALTARSLRGQPTGPDNLTLIRKDGSRVNVEISTLPVTISGEKVVLGIARDISQRLASDQEARNKLAEMGKINKLMVGRELDMINLKKEVNGLLARLGESPKYKT